MGKSCPERSRGLENTSNFTISGSVVQVYPRFLNLLTVIFGWCVGYILPYHPHQKVSHHHYNVAWKVWAWHSSFFPFEGLPCFEGHVAKQQSNNHVPKGKQLPKSFPSSVQTKNEAKQKPYDFQPFSSMCCFSATNQKTKQQPATSTSGLELLRHQRAIPATVPLPPGHGLLSCFFAWRSSHGFSNGKKHGPFQSMWWPSSLVWDGFKMDTNMNKNGMNLWDKDDVFWGTIVYGWRNGIWVVGKMTMVETWDDYTSFKKWIETLGCWEKVRGKPTILHHDGCFQYVTRPITSKKNG